VNPILLTLALTVIPQADLRQAGLTAAIHAAVQDAQQLARCQEVPSGPCVKLPPTGADIFATVAIVADNVCAFYDITSTLAGTVTGDLVELNPILHPFAGNAALMTTVRAGMQIAKWWVFRSMKNKGPTWAKWTGVTASGTAALGCGAAIHNTRELNR
jgi:hypothetical protein